MFDSNQKSTNPHQSLGAIFLIFLGIIYLLATFGLIGWGAIGLIFLFLPALWGAYNGWRTYRETGELNSRVITHLLWGLFPFVFLGLIYVGFNMGKLWPVVFIFAGATLLFNKKEW